MADPVDELERLHEAAVYRSSRTWIAGKAREDGSAQVYSPSIGPLRQVVPVCETEAETAPLIAAMFCSLPELIKQARLAQKAEAFLREHGDIAGVALAAAEQADHLKIDRATLRALAALRKEFGIDG